ncbi:MAG: hypothetical protein H6Q73_3852 [Firmicutes bacterium]|nr:hypothetical protein [Bacillota bacterium]
MFVEVMYSDKWEKKTDKGQDVDNPTWRQIESAIRALDGKVRTQVVIGDGDEGSMCIGGGNDGLYNVFVTIDDNESFYTLIDAAKSKAGTVQLATGGQVEVFAEYTCIELAKVLRAAKAFAEKGKMDAALEWEFNG